MWFDGTDPRDPQQLTAGVDALLAAGLSSRTTPTSGCGGCSGSEDPAGLGDWRPPRRTKRSSGDVCSGPWAAGNWRRATTTAGPTSGALRSPFRCPPRRGSPCARGPGTRWTANGIITVGVWFEMAVLVHQVHDLAPEPIPADFYCAGVRLHVRNLGQGLTALAEHMKVAAGEDLLGAFGDGDFTDFSAFSLRYPWGAVDEFGLIVYHDWDERGPVHFSGVAAHLRPVVVPPDGLRQSRRDEWDPGHAPGPGRQPAGRQRCARLLIAFNTEDGP
jgi:hypothetical protein